MPPFVATLIFTTLIATLFWFDRERSPRTSPALLLPLIWMFIGASRMASQWLGVAPLDVETTLDGSPFDRVVLMGLLAGGIMVLLARGERVGAALRGNGLLVVFFLYCIVSVLWSDFPFVAFKRLTKGVGNFVMVLVILSDPHPAAAFKRFFAWTGFLLIPLSILLIKYYPTLGRMYNRWTWDAYFTGVSTDKNGLGGICLIVGLATLWRLIGDRRPDGESNRRRIIAHGLMFVMTLWLFVKADSSTAIACFVLGAVLMVMAMRSRRVHGLVAVIVLVMAFGALVPNGYSYVVEALGRNTTLTGRTELWDDLFRMEVNQWVGRGYESFWLGDRADFMANKYYFHPNQAHNGYIEMYVNLGIIGVALLLGLMAVGYKRIADACRTPGGLGPLRLAYLVTIAVYNVTEATFKVMHPIWIVFLIAIAASHESPKSEV